MKEKIRQFRTFLLKHFKNKQIQTLISGLISYEMISYMFFGMGTAAVDYIVFSTFTALGMNSLISNIISTPCAVIFSYTTNKIWVFKSKTHGFSEVFHEFLKFANARIATLVMTEFILLFTQIFDGNEYIAKLVSMILTIILNYIFSKLFIFNKGKVKENDKKKS